MRREWDSAHGSQAGVPARSQWPGGVDQCDTNFRDGEHYPWRPRTIDKQGVKIPE